MLLPLHSLLRIYELKLVSRKLIVPESMISLGDDAGYILCVGRRLGVDFPGDGWEAWGQGSGSVRCCEPSFSRNSPDIT